MSREPHKPAEWLAARIALTYAVFAALWIVVTDSLLIVFGFDTSPHMQTYKGLVFVTVTAGGLFLTVRLYATRTLRARREASEASRAVDRLYRLLGDLSSLLVRADSERELYTQICDSVVEAGVFDGAWVLEPPVGDGPAEIVAASGAEVLGRTLAASECYECDLKNCVVCSVFETGKQHIVNDVRMEVVEPCVGKLAERGLRAMASLPITHRGETVASFSVFSTTPGVFTDAEPSLLERLASDLSVGVTRLRDAADGRVIQSRLESSEHRYRQLFESNPRPMWVYDLDTLRFLDVNEAAVKHYGYARDEFLGMTIADIRPTEDVPALLQNVGRVTEGIDDAGLWRHLTKDGRTLLVDITSHVFDFEGRKAELVLADDVTALSEATTALRRTAARLKALFDIAPAAIILVDPEGAVTEWNPSAERIFGWKAEAVLGKPLPIQASDDFESFVKTLGESLRGGGTRRFEGRRLTKSGAKVDVVIYTAPLIGEPGGLDEVMAIILDVTEEKRAELELRLYRERLEELVEARTRELATLNEQLRLATRVKSEFLTNMSHELRTPLNSIIGFSGILMQGLTGELTGEQAKQVGMVHRSGKHLLELINDILDLSRIEAGRVSVEPVTLELRSLVASVIEELRPQAERKGIDILMEDGDEQRVSTDRTKIRQILYNLVGNAIKFTDEGRVVITLQDDEPLVSVRVTDTGLGIPPDEIDAVFDEFHQARRGADAKPTGTGLGLAISRKLARMLGGDITVESTPGEGSVFAFEMPRVVSPLQGQRPDPPSE